MQKKKEENAEKDQGSEEEKKVETEGVKRSQPCERKEEVEEELSKKVKIDEVV